MSDLPSRWLMTQACRDECHDQCARSDGVCTCTCHWTPALPARATQHSEETTK